MSNNLLMCYENEYCYFCKKLNCENRTHKSGYSEKIAKMCDGNCYECSEAIRNSLYTKLFSELKFINEKFISCLMYQYFTESKNFEFCGRTGKQAKYSKIELAILQLRKCYKCEEKREYFKILAEISSKINEIPICFESKTELTATRALSIANTCISDVLERDFNCKTKIVLKRLIKEYLALNEAEEINLNALCEYIISNKINIDYYIHPLTVKAVLCEIEKDELN